MIVHRPLVALRPEWIATGGVRYQMGIEFDCPGHEGAEHRLRLWFDNPCDGEEPAPLGVVERELYPMLVHRVGGYDFLDNLTLVPRHNRDMPIRVYQHWSGYVIEGEVHDALSIGW